MCGRTVSPFPHAHSTSRLIHPHVGKESTTTPFFIVSSHKELGEPFFWHSWFSSVCAIHVSGLLWVLSYDWGFLDILYLLIGLELTSTRIVCPSSRSWEIVVGFPTILVCYGFIFVLGCCGFLLSHFGHYRAKNDSRIKFPRQSCVLPELSPRLFCGVWFSSPELWIACFAMCM